MRIFSWLIFFFGLLLLISTKINGLKTTSGINQQHTKKIKTLTSTKLFSGTDLEPQTKRTLAWLPDGIKDSISSGLSTILVKIILQPFDTIKTLQQTSDVSRGVLETATIILKSRGIGGLWAGTLISAFGSTPSVAVYFGVYSAIKKRLTKVFVGKYRLVGISIAAVLANTIASFLRVPYEILKQRLQVGMHKSLLEAIQYSYFHDGLFGLFLGGKLVSQIVRDVPYALFTAIFYDLLQKFFENLNKDKKVGELSHQRQDAMCGALAGGASTFLTTPMDVIKTRLMNADSRYSSFLDALTQISSKEGLPAFFSGVDSRLLHKIPANGLFFLFYEAFRYLLGSVTKRSEQ